MLLKKLPGINVQTPWARMLLSGEKTTETRTYSLPLKYVGHDLWLIETPGKIGKFTARVIGIIRFSGSEEYKSEKEFYDKADRHLILSKDSEYAWKIDVRKFGWIVEHVQPVEEFLAPSPRGIVYARPFGALIERHP